MIKLNHYLINAPNGHAFGFPKAFEGDIDALDIASLLRENGYPNEWIRAFPNGKDCSILGPIGDA